MKKTARYLRLSSDDHTDGESDSISNQRHIIQQYIDAQPDLAATEIVDYKDDGYTGTNFNRPAMRKMLEDIHEGEIGTIVVKDLSRFGRELLTVGRYLELFPLIGVRFISVNDNYDTANKSVDNLAVRLKTVLHELYSRENSKKVKSGKQSLAHRGELYSSHAIFGYKTTQDGKGDKTWVIDEPAAKIVREIFTLFIDGMTVNYMAASFNERGIPTPLEYKNQQFGRSSKKTRQEKTLWTYHTIKRILTAEQYTGSYIALRREAGVLGSGKSVLKNKSDWVCIPGKHPAIISMDDFKAAGQRFRRLCTARGPDKKRLFSKKVFCGHCNRLMAFRELADKEYNQFFCKTARLTDRFGCPHTLTRESDLVQMVLTVLKSYAMVLLDMDKAMESVQDEQAKTIAAQKRIRIDMNSSRNKLRNQIRIQYEKYRSGRHTRDEYIKRKEQLAGQISELEEAIRQTGTLIVAGPPSSTDRFLKIFDTDNPPQELVDAFIEKLYLYDNRKVEIKFKAACVGCEGGIAAQRGKPDLPVST